MIRKKPGRGIGLGTKLMKLYMDILKECGYKESYLWTTHELTAAFIRVCPIQIDGREGFDWVWQTAEGAEVRNDPNMTRAVFLQFWNTDT